MLYKYLSGKVNLSIYYLQIQIEISHKICTYTQRNRPPQKNELNAIPPAEKNHDQFIYPVILRILGFFSSSFSRKIPSSLAPNRSPNRVGSHESPHLVCLKTRSSPPLQLPISEAMELNRQSPGWAEIPGSASLMWYLSCEGKYLWYC